MSWQVPIVEVRQAHLKGALAEHAGQWHLVVQHYLYCLEWAGAAGDERATRFFAAKLCSAYERMAMYRKAEYYRRLC